MVSRARLLLVNTASSYVRFAVLFVTQFALLPFIIRRIGLTDYGTWSLATSVLGFFTLLDFGFAPGVVKYVAVSRGSGDVAGRNRMLSTIALVYLGLAALALIAVVLLGLTYGQLFSIPEASRSKAVAVLWILGVRAVAFTLPLGLFRGALFGEQKILHYQRRTNRQLPPLGVRYLGGATNRVAVWWPWRG